MLLVLASSVLEMISSAMAYDIVPVVAPGTISGHISFSGNPPSPKVFRVQKDPEVCGEKRSLITVDVNAGLVKGVVLTLEGVTQGKPFESKNEKASLLGEGEFQFNGGRSLNLDVQIKGCNFGPFTGVLVADDPVSFINQDPIKHTLHTYVLKKKKAKLFLTLHNQAILPHQAKEKEFTTEKLGKGRVVSLICDRHEFMRNWLYVVSSPYFAVSDDRGHYSIDQVPPGNYELVAWHPLLGTKRQKIRVLNNEYTSIDFKFR